MEIVFLPDDKLRLKKLEVPSIYTGTVYGTSVVGILGTSYTQDNITSEIIITAFSSSIFPAMLAFFMKLQKIFER